MPFLNAPAKVNLGLRVLGRRADGYHLLESLFLPLNLHDSVGVEAELEPIRLGAIEPEVEFALRTGAFRDSGVPAGADNLAVRAARRFCEAAGLAGSIRIELIKRIPAGAGLGGGSSDAGAVLRALRDLNPAALDEQALEELALGLGADVPFFLRPEPSLVTGIGEQRRLVEGIPALWLLLLNPRIPLATREVFRAYDALDADLTPPEAGSTMRALEGLGASGPAGFEDFAKLLDAGLLRNDLEPAAHRLCPPVARLQERLRSIGVSRVGMSGSGATVFGIFDSGESAREAASAALKGSEFEQDVWVRVVRSAPA